MTEKLLSEKWLKPEHLQAIGMVAVEWSYLEHIIDDSIWQYAKIDDDIGRCFTTHMSVPMRIDVLKSLFFEHFGNSEKYKALSKIAKDIKDTVSPLRNKIVHSPWLEPENNQDAAQYLSVSARGQLKTTVLPMDVAEIRQAAETIEDYGNRLVYFVDTNPPPPSSSQTP